MTAAIIDSTSSTAARTSSRGVWIGRVLSGLAVLFIIFDAVIKLVASKQAVDATVALGYPASLIQPIGVIEVICLIIYIVPRTAPLGAVLWTGYLGGALASQLRAGNPLFSHVLFPIYVAALIWGGLWLRDPRVRALIRPSSAAQY